MQRSVSLNRFSDDYFKSSVANSQSAGMRSSSNNAYDANFLPKYDPIAELAKKEFARARFAENAVHVIPFVIFACAIILWFFSYPDVGIVDAKLQGLNIEGEIENNSDGTQTGILPMVNVGDMSTEQFEVEKVSIKQKI